MWKAEHQGFSEEQTWAWCRQTLVEASALAAGFGVTLALQNHPPVIKGYADTIRMAKEVASPNLKICFDARLEHTLDEAAVRKAVNEVGALQTLWHFGGEYDRGAAGITVKGDEKALAEALGLFDIGYQGYAGFELCHPLPVSKRPDRGRGLRGQERATRRRVHARHPGRGEEAARRLKSALLGAEGYCGIDSCGAAGWEIAGQGGDQCQQHGHSEEGQRVAGGDPEEHILEGPGESPRGDGSDQQSSGGEQQGLRR